jgi:hypothetical protein
VDSSCIYPFIKPWVSANVSPLVQLQGHYWYPSARRHTAKMEDERSHLGHITTTPTFRRRVIDLQKSEEATSNVMWLDMILHISRHGHTIFHFCNSTTETRNDLQGYSWLYACTRHPCDTHLFSLILVTPSPEGQGAR